MIWRSININTNLIEVQTNKATLIKMPHNSDYDGYCFWHTNKLIRKGKHTAAVSVSYTAEFVFKLKKFGNGRYNRSMVIDETEITVEEFENAFGVVDENISPAKSVNEYETYKPAPIEAETPEILKELIDE